MEAGEFALLGDVWVERDSKGALVSVHLSGLQNEVSPSGAQPMSADLRDAFERYEHGHSEALLGLSLVPASTPFAAEVRRAMRGIAAGTVRTYGELARAMGKPGAARAVGQACRRNPLPLVVPCHRVVASSGIGGFALGLDAKRALLAIEGFDVAMRTGFR